MIRDFEEPYTQGLCQILLKWLKYKSFKAVEINTAVLSQRKSRRNVAGECNTIGGNQRAYSNF
jgi:hypothetical protein